MLVTQDSVMSRASYIIVSDLERPHEARRVQGNGGSHGERK